jgi:hypothetical protein
MGYAVYGRCRSGRRWFWAAASYENDTEIIKHGFKETEQQALAAGRAAARRLADSHYVSHGYARDRLKHVNAERRRARPAADASDAQQVEYLYGRTDGSCHWDGNQCGCDDLEGRAKWDYHIVGFRITKKTPKRVYYVRKQDSWEPDGVVIGYVDRQKLEADGEASPRSDNWWAADSTLYLRPPEPPAQPTSADQRAEVSRLRAEMAAAHPDRGGSSKAFIEARNRYMAAKRGRP